jgi:hypothetical protein
MLNMQQHMHVSYHARIGVILKGQNAGKEKWEGRGWRMRGQNKGMKKRHN